MIDPARSTWLGYGVAVAPTAAVVLLRAAPAAVLPEDASLILFLVSVMAAAWLGGWKPGLLATALGVAAGAYLLSERDGWPISGTGNIVRLVLFAVLGGLVSLLCEATHSVWRRAERLVEDARHYAESVVATVREPLVVLTADLRVKAANRSFYQTFRVAPEQTQGRLIYELGDGQWDIPRLRTLLEDVLPHNTSFDDYEVEHDFPAVGTKSMLLNARRLHKEGDRIELILLAIEDISEQKRAVDCLKVSEVRYRRLFESAKDGILILDARTARITDANPFLGELLGYPHADLLGKELWEIGLFKDAEASKAAVRELQERRYTVADGEPVYTTIHSCTGDNPAHPVDSR